MNRIALALVGIVCVAGNWPSWRGPTQNGLSTETNLPVEWSLEKNLLWKSPLTGMGSSTPAVWGNSIFLTAQDESKVVLICIGTDGKERWKRTLGDAGALARKDEGNSASPSPATDGKHVWAMAGSGEFACYDFAGKEVWKFNTQDRYGKYKYQFGMHSTPVLHDGRLYLQLIHSVPAYVIALDAATGKDIWKIVRKSDGRAECEHSYASLTLWQDGANAYIIAHGNDYATAHSLKDGSEIWRLGGLNPKDKYNPTLRFVASPVAVKDLIVVPSAKNGPVVAVKPTATGTFASDATNEQWRRPKDTPDVPSPLVVDGLVYLCRENGVLICMDALTGKEYYSERLHNQRYRASPSFADGKIYCTARDGTVSVVAAGKDYKLLAQNRLPDETTASLAFADGVMYVRGFKFLYAFKTK